MCISNLFRVQNRFGRGKADSLVGGWAHKPVVVGLLVVVMYDFVVRSGQCNFGIKGLNYVTYFISM